MEFELVLQLINNHTHWEARNPRSDHRSKNQKADNDW